MYLVVSIIILSQPLGLNSLLYLVLCLRAGCLRVYLIFSFYFWTLVFPYETTFRFSLFIFPLPLVADYCCMFPGVYQAFLWQDEDNRMLSAFILPKLHPKPVSLCLDNGLFFIYSVCVQCLDTSNQMVQKGFIASLQGVEVFLHFSHNSSYPSTFRVTEFAALWFKALQGIKG